jgi:flagellar protein FlaI
MAIEYGKSMLFAGGTATGKTSFLGAMSMFLPSDAKIVSIEDTPEVRLPHEHWVQKVVRSGFGREDLAGRKQGEVTMYDLLRAALRERPDEIIVGEVRGREAYVLFQGMASVRGNEEVTVVDCKGVTHKTPVKELMNKDLNGYKAVTIDPETKKTKLLPLKACVEHAPRKKLYEIQTVTGRKVQVTGDHSVFTFKNGEIKQTLVKNLSEKDELVVPRKVPCGYSDVKWVDLTSLENVRVVAPKYVKKAVEKLGWEKAGQVCGVKTISDYYGQNNSALHATKYKTLLQTAKVKNSIDEIKVKFDRKSECFPAKLELTDELLRLMGYYISDGSLNSARKNNAIQFYNSDERVLKDFEKCVKAVTGKTPCRRETRGYGKCVELSFNHKVLFEFLKQECGHGAAKKRVPGFVHGLSKQRISQFLTGLYAGDGYLGEKMFQYATKSKNLASDVMHLLACYGITAHCYKGQGIYKIEFYRENEKQEFLNHVKPVNKKTVLCKQGKPNPRIHGDVYADPVKKVREVTLEHPEPVYDLCVPGTQNFVGGFGGVMLHNTGHSGMATIHGDSVDSVIHRLQTKPINLSPGLLQHLDIIVILTRAKVKGVEVRRVKQIVEILGLNKKDEPIINTLFEWSPAEETFDFKSDKSYVLEDIIREKGVEETEIWKEIQRRTKVLEWMRKEKIRYYEDVGRVIQRYYSNPEKLLKGVT